MTGNVVSLFQKAVSKVTAITIVGAAAALTPAAAEEGDVRDHAQHGLLASRGQRSDLDTSACHWCELQSCTV